MAQIAVPISDIAVNGWTNPSYSAIDEGVASHDSSYTSSPNKADGTLQCNLTSLTDPYSSINHIMKVWGYVTTTGVATINIHLYSGATLIKTWTPSWTGSNAYYTYTLSSSEADAITDYTDLNIYFEFDYTSGAQGRGYIDAFEFEVPSSSAITLTVNASAHTNTSQSPLLTQVHNLTGNNSAHSQLADGNLNLVENINVTVNSTQHILTSENATLVAINRYVMVSWVEFELPESTTAVLSIDDSFHKHTNFDYIIFINHETGDFSDYTGIENHNDQMTVSESAALMGTNYGLSINIADLDIDSQVYGYKTLDVEDTQAIIGVRFYINSNNISAGGSAKYVLRLCNILGGAFADVWIAISGGLLTIVPSYTDNTGSSRSNAYISLSNSDTHVVELYLTKGDETGIRLTSYVNNVKKTIGGYSNTNQFTEFKKVEFGFMPIFTETCSGTLYLDELIINNTGKRIGANADSLSLTQIHNLIVQNSEHSHSTENILLTQIHIITVLNGAHTHTSEGIVLSITTGLVVQDSVHAFTSDNILLIQVHSLLMQDSSHILYSESILLTQINILVLQSTEHIHFAESPVIIQLHILIINNTQHSHIVDAILLVQIHNLLSQSSEHLHTTENLVLIQTFILTVINSSHQFYSENILLIQLHNLLVNYADHIQTGEHISLSQAGFLSVSSVSHILSSENTLLIQIHNLLVNFSEHSFFSENILLLQIHNLLINASTHLQTVENILLEQIHIILVENIIHLLQSENVSISQTHNVSILNSSHILYSELLNLVLVLMTILRPTEDISLGEWTDQDDGIINIYQSIDEATPDDEDYVKSPVLPQSNTYKFKLTNGSDPEVHYAHTIAFRFSKPVGAETVSLKTRLIEGSTTRVTWEDIASSDIITIEHTMTEEQAATITDYSNLFVELEAV